jgi:hypothetical protein
VKAKPQRLTLKGRLTGEYVSPEDAIPNHLDALSPEKKLYGAHMHCMHISQVQICTWIMHMKKERNYVAKLPL